MKGTDIQRCIAVVQAVMRVRNLYDGAIDGVWGPKCVASIRDWERDESFDPALPTKGMMFQAPGRLPKGLMWKPGRGLSIMYAALPAAEAAEVTRLLETEYAPLTNDMINDALKEGAEAPNIVLGGLADAAKKIAAQEEVQPAPAPAPAPTQQPTQGNQQGAQRNSGQPNQQRKP